MARGRVSAIGRTRMHACDRALRQHLASGAAHLQMRLSHCAAIDINQAGRSGDAVAAAGDKGTNVSGEQCKVVRMPPLCIIHRAYSLPDPSAHASVRDTSEVVLPGIARSPRSPLTPSH